MKNIFKSSLLLLCGVCLFTACEDDNDSNPTLQQPTTFVLNTPAYAASAIDLATSTEIPFTWSQPDYGFPVAAQYQLQVSLNDSWTVSTDQAAADESGATVADYATIEDVYSQAKGALNAAKLSKALQQIALWPAEAVPATQLVKVRALSVLNADTIYSNTVDVTVVPYYVELKDAAPIMWYLVGNNIGDGSWGTVVGQSAIPMFFVEGYSYDKATGVGEISYLNYFDTEGWKIQPADFDWYFGFMSGGTANTAVYRDNGDDNGNIWCDPAGYYLVTINTGTKECVITQQDITPKVYDQICITGSFNEWSDENMVPVNKTGENHVWCYTMTVNPGEVEQIKFKIPGSWDTNWGYGTADGEINVCGKGTNGGKNIGIPEGTWVIMLNDITGEFSILAKE